MIAFTEDYDDSGLKSLGLVLEDLIQLQLLLTDAEHKKINGIEDAIERVNKIVTVLNNRRALPEDYRDLTNKWNGFEGIYIKEDILF